MIAPPRPLPHDEQEALIREARARQRRRRLAAAGTFAVLAGGALAVHSVAVGSGSPGTRAAHHGRPLSTRPCDAAAGWRLEPGPAWSEPTGRHTAVVDLVRRASNSCTLRGYPTVVLLDSAGRTLDFRYSHAGDVVVTGRPPKTVRVGGGSPAFFVFDKYRCDIHATSVARSLRVRVPGIRGRLRLRLPHYPIIDFCPAAGPSRTIAVSPVVGKLAQAAAHRS